MTKRKELPAPECSVCGRATATMTLPLPIEGPEVTTINLCYTCHMKAQARMLDFPDQPCSFGHDRQATAAVEMIIDDGEKIPIFYCESCILSAEWYFDFGMDALDAGAHIADYFMENINGILLKHAEMTWGKKEAPSHVPPWPKCDICKSRPAFSLIEDKAHGQPVKMFLCLECATEGRETMLSRKHLCSFCTEEANMVLTSLKTGLPIDLYLGEVCSNSIVSSLVYHLLAKMLKIEG